MSTPAYPKYFFSPFVDVFYGMHDVETDHKTILVTVTEDTM